MPQFLGVQTSSSIPGRDRVRDIMAEALLRSLSVYMEITTIVSQLCMGIDRLSEPFNVGQVPDGVILRESQHNRDIG